MTFHGMPNLVFWENKEKYYKMSSEISIQHAKCPLIYFDYTWMASSEKVPLNILKMCRFRLSCTWAKYHLGHNSPFISSVVSNDSFS